MCDYSLHSVSTRPARLGDELVSTRFTATATRGLASAAEPETAVCLSPGTEIAFEVDVKVERPFWLRIFLRPKTIRQRVGRFRQLDLYDPHRHHDAIELPDGKLVLITRLIEGQQLTVLQLPRSKLDPATPNPHVPEQALT